MLQAYDGSRVVENRMLVAERRCKEIRKLKRLRDGITVEVLTHELHFSHLQVVRLVASLSKQSIENKKEFRAFSSRSIEQFWVCPQRKKLRGALRPTSKQNSSAVVIMFRVVSLQNHGLLYSSLNDFALSSLQNLMTQWWNRLDI